MDAKELLQQESLRDLKRLSVVIEHLSPQVEENGLTREHLCQLVRHRLHEEDIEILPKEEIYPGVPYLYVNVNVMKTNVGLNVFATQVVLKQRMILPREPFVEMHAATWEIAGVGTVGTNNLTAIAESICKLIDKFSHDYRAMNPAAYFSSEFYHHSRYPSPLRFMILSAAGNAVNSFWQVLGSSAFEFI